MRKSRKPNATLKPCAPEEKWRWCAKAWAALPVGQRRSEGALIQALVVEHKAAVFPVQQLDEAAGTV